jgi:hypothetical protein
MQVLDRSAELAPPAAHAVSSRGGERRPWVQWLPLGLALAVFAQVAMLGMRPALAESRRLGRAEERLADRYQRASAESAELGERLRAQADPIYLERERRLLRAPNSPLRSGEAQ